MAGESGHRGECVQIFARGIVRRKRKRAEIFAQAGLISPARAGQSGRMENFSSSEQHSFCDSVRRQIEHEDSLVVNRLSWLMASQSFLFTAYAIVCNGPLSARSTAFTAGQDHLLSVVPLLGIACCVLIYAGVLGAAVVMTRLRADLAVRVKGSLRDVPPVQGSRMTRTLGMAAPLLLPPAFCAAWFYLAWR
jgi:hypothetical protein